MTNYPNNPAGNFQDIQLSIPLNTETCSQNSYCMQCNSFWLLRISNNWTHIHRIYPLLCYNRLHLDIGLVRSRIHWIIEETLLHILCKFEYFQAGILSIFHWRRHRHIGCHSRFSNRLNCNQWCIRHMQNKSLESIPSNCLCPFLRNSCNCHHISRKCPGNQTTPHCNSACICQSRHPRHLLRKKGSTLCNFRQCLDNSRNFPRTIRSRPLTEPRGSLASNPESIPPSRTHKIRIR